MTCVWFNDGLQLGDAVNVSSKVSCGKLQKQKTHYAMHKVCNDVLSPEFMFEFAAAAY